MRSAFSCLMISMLAGCIHVIPVHKENTAPTAVVLPLKMCTQSGTMSMSLGDEGERMVCERLIPIGSHLAQCICKDEGLIAKQTRETQEVLNQIEMQPTASAH